ncbi:hypothetical protein V5799_027008 [Amblyomma americanum]|uniref:Uncharacterized protein n=1 Tax=Amblyomma americanum TaxID=6943 RepID=A0AAQ4DGY6_AMBAM
MENARALGGRRQRQHLSTSIVLKVGAKPLLSVRCLNARRRHAETTACVAAGQSNEAALAAEGDQNTPRLSGEEAVRVTRTLRCDTTVSSTFSCHSPA